MYITAAKLKQLSHYTHLNKDFRSDLHWWNAFISIWNGTGFLQALFHHTNFDYSIQTNALGSWGCGAFFFPHWFQYAWTIEWTSTDIMAKELVPIIISCAIWALLLVHKEIQFQCDNQSLVSAINKGSSKDSMVMHLLRCLWFIIASFHIHITATHLTGIHNNAADMLSRDQGNEFCLHTPKPPNYLLPYLSPTKPSLSANAWLDIVIIGVNGNLLHWIND